MKAKGFLYKCEKCEYEERRIGKWRGFQCPNCFNGFCKFTQEEEDQNE